MLPDQTDTRVLVTIPPGWLTDVLCVLGFYLAFLLTCAVSTVFRCIDEQDCILQAWKGQVSGVVTEYREDPASGPGWPLWRLRLAARRGSLYPASIRVAPLELSPYPRLLSLTMDHYDHTARI